MKSSAITRLFFWTRLADTRTVHGRIKYGMSTAVDYDDNDTRRTEGPNLKRDFVIETTAYASRWGALFHPISGSMRFSSSVYSVDQKSLSNSAASSSCSACHRQTIAHSQKISLNSVAISQQLLATGLSRSLFI